MKTQAIINIIVLVILGIISIMCFIYSQFDVLNVIVGIFGGIVTGQLMTKNDKKGGE